MISEQVDRAYVGCATDKGFVGPTCTMLSSLADNGDIPEAIVIVADFGLDDQDRDLIRTSAGQLGDRMEFLPLGPGSPEIVAMPAYRLPLPLLGRLVIPRTLHEPRSRLLTLDSDMLVNWSVRPLFEMSMRGFPLAAVHDPIAVREHWGREADHGYFNAGLMLIDLDLFNADDLAGRAMRLLASYDPPPRWYDQDALNEVLRDRWLTLDRRWNFFHAADRRDFTAQDYKRADIIHFAGPKPWDGHDHPAKWLYEHHANRVAEKTIAPERRGQQPVDRVFAANCYQVLLGRELEGTGVPGGREHFSRAGFFRSVVNSDEFRNDVLLPVRNGVPFQAGRFLGPIRAGDRFFAADSLPLLSGTAARIETARDWAELLTAITQDRSAMAGVGG